MQFLNGLGWRLLVFWNSAKPYRVSEANAAGNSCDHIAWRAKGDLLAFTVGDTLYVWEPTLEAGGAAPTAAPAVK